MENRIEALQALSLMQQKEIQNVFVDTFMYAYSELIQKQLLNAQELEKLLIDSSKEMFDKVAQDKQTCLVTKKKNDNQIIAFMTVEQENENHVYIAQLAVLPAYQRQRVASSLINYLFQLFPNVTTFYGFVRKTNDKAQLFYSKFNNYQVSDEHGNIKYKDYRQFNFTR